MRIEPTRPLRVVVNANASGMAHPRNREHVVAALAEAGGQVDLRLTATLEELASVWAEDDPRRLVVVGGDGSLHAVANLGGPRREVALIPVGGANNIARSLGIPLDLRGAARLAVEGRSRPVDLIEARTADRRRLVLESVSVGFLAQARVRYQAPNSTDLLAGARAGAAALVRFHPMAVRIIGPTGSERLHLSQLFVANLPLYEFGLRIAPHADPSDRSMDVIGIEAPTRRAVLKMVLDLRRGTHIGHPNVHTWRATDLAILTNGASPIIADSEDLGPGPVELQVAPAELRLVRP